MAKKSCCGTKSGRLCSTEKGLTTEDPEGIKLKNRIRANYLVVYFFSAQLPTLTRLVQYRTRSKNTSTSYSYLLYEASYTINKEWRFVLSVSMCHCLSHNVSWDWLQPSRNPLEEKLVYLMGGWMDQIICSLFSQVIFGLKTFLVRK